MKVLFKNARIVLPEAIIDGCVETENGIITAVRRGKADGCAQSIDVHGQYLCPGFVEIHTHGAGGADFMDGTEEAFLTACRTHLQHGTTTIYPTLLAASNEELDTAIETFLRVKSRLGEEGITAPGIHLEGPYLNPEQKGAINEAFIRPPRRAEYEPFVQKYAGAIARWPIAPELNGALELGDQLNRLGVLVSVGHSNAVYAQVKEAAEHGFRHVTHLYSAMSTITRKNGFRYAGVLESTFCLPQLTAEIIADGCHLPPELIRMVYTLLGVERVCFCCDSMRCAGEQVTRSFLGNPQSGIPVIIEDGVAKLCDRSAFAGSVATDDRLVRTAVEQAEIPLTDAVRMMSLTPAQIMRVDARKGSIAPGKNADFVVLDETLRVSSVYAGARMVWEN